MEEISYHYSIFGSLVFCDLFFYYIFLARFVKLISQFCCDVVSCKTHALKRLKNDEDIVILPADKGRVTVVRDKTDYHD